MGLITGWTRDLGLHMRMWLVRDLVIIVIISETCPAVVICSKVISSVLQIEHNIPGKGDVLVGFLPPLQWQ